MTKYIKVFDNHQDYLTFKEGDDFIKPNVSHCIEQNEVHYNPNRVAKVVVYYNFEEDGYLWNVEQRFSTYAVDTTPHIQKLVVNGTEVDAQELNGGYGEYSGNTVAEFTFDNNQIPMVMFYMCDSITKIIVYGGITYIANYSIIGIDNIKTIEFKEGIEGIGSNFYNTPIRSLTIPNSVEYFGCIALTNVIETITVKPKNATYDSRNNCNAIIETATNKLIQGCKNTVIPNDVTIIESNAFNGCMGLTSITIPNSVTEIGWGAFMNCSDLTNVIISDGVTTIYNNAFNSCVNLTSVTIGSGITDIKDRAFMYSSNLESLTIEATTPPTLGGDSLSYTSSDLKIYVPSASVDTYKAASGWSSYASKIQAIP